MLQIRYKVQKRLKRKFEFGRNGVGIWLEKGFRWLRLLYIDLIVLNGKHCYLGHDPVGQNLGGF